MILDHKRNHIWFVVLIVVVSGCLESPMGSGEDDEAPDHSARQDWRFALERPIIINRSNEPVKVDMSFSEGCGRNTSYIPMGWKQFDRYGLQNTGVEVFDFTQDKMHSFIVDLEGDPPYVIAGDPDLICFDQTRTHVHGVVSGFRMGLDVKMNITRYSEFVPVELNRGESRNSVYWYPGDYDWFLSQVWLPKRYDGEQNPRGDFYGRIEMRDELGQLVRAFEQHPLGSLKDENWAFTLLGDSYEISVELDHPATSQTRWVYGIETWQFNDAICPYGFEWPGICT